VQYIACVTLKSDKIAVSCSRFSTICRESSNGPLFIGPSCRSAVSWRPLACSDNKQTRKSHTHTHTHTHTAAGNETITWYEAFSHKHEMSTHTLHKCHERNTSLKNNCNVLSCRRRNVRHSTRIAQSLYVNYPSINTTTGKIATTFLPITLPNADRLKKFSWTDLAVNFWQSDNKTSHTPTLPCKILMLEKDQ